MTGQLTAHCSTTERLTNNRLKEADSHSMDQHMTKKKLMIAEQFAIIYATSILGKSSYGRSQCILQ